MIALQTCSHIARSMGGENCISDCRDNMYWRLKHIFYAGQKCSENWSLNSKIWPILCEQGLISGQIWQPWSEADEFQNFDTTGRTTIFFTTEIYIIYIANFITNGVLAEKLLLQIIPITQIKKQQQFFRK